MLDIGGWGAVKQGTAFSSASMSSQLEKVAGASFSLAFPPRVVVGVSSSVGQMSLVEVITTSSYLGPTTSEGDTCTDGLS